MRLLQLSAVLAAFISLACAIDLPQGPHESFRDYVKRVQAAEKAQGERDFDACVNKRVSSLPISQVSQDLRLTMNEARRHMTFSQTAVQSG